MCMSRLLHCTVLQYTALLTCIVHVQLLVGSVVTCCSLNLLEHFGIPAMLEMAHHGMLLLLVVFVDLLHQRQVCNIDFVRCNRDAGWGQHSFVLLPIKPYHLSILSVYL